MTFHDTDALPEGAITFQHRRGRHESRICRSRNTDRLRSLRRADVGAQIMAGAFGRCAICAGAITVPGEPASGIRRPLTPNDSIVDMPAISQPVELGAAARPIDPLAADFPSPAQQPPRRGIAPSARVPSSPATPATNAPVAPRLITPNAGMKTADAPPMAARRLDRSIRSRRRSPWRLRPVLPTPRLPPERKRRYRLSGPPGISVGFRPARRKRFRHDHRRVFLRIAGIAGGHRLRDLRHATPRRQNGLATLSAVICLFGVAGGVITSSFIFNVPLWGIR